MAIDDGPYEPQPQYASPLMNFQSMTLLTVVLQFIAGVVALYYALPGFITILLILSYITDISTQIYMIVWGILPIVGIVQIYFGYRLYKKEAGTIGKALIADAIAVVLFGVDIVISAFEGLLFPYPEVIGYFAMNVVLLILLNMTSVRNDLESQSSGFQPDYFQY
ncbi:MAG: hypothetical protein ACFFDM_10390 [Candidatus Thorarchaeota archaeon]